MSEQQTGEWKSACPHPEAVGTRWGDPISEERQTESQTNLRRRQPETNHGERSSPLDGGPGDSRVRLTGIDLFWLTEVPRRR